MKKLTTLFLAVILIFVMTACGGKTNENSSESTSFPMTVTDYLGTEMTFDAVPEKIVSLSPSCTEILYELGLGDKIVGVSNWCTYPKEVENVEKVGDTYSVSVEKIIELEADVVFISGAASAESVEALNTAGINVYSIGAKDVNGIFSSIEAVGKVTGTSEEATVIVDGMKEKLQTLEEQFGQMDTKSVFLDLGDLYSSGSEDYLGASFSLINAENIALDAGANSPQLSAETVIERNPQVYIVLSSQENFTKPAGFDEIDAFKNGEVYYIDYADPATDMITRDGPRFIDGLEYLGNLIHKTDEK